MRVEKMAVAGTLESSDAMVTVEPCEDGITFELESAVIHQYGKQIRRVVLQTLENLGVTHAAVTVVDHGALDCTIKARVECAVHRANGISKDVYWGGTVR